MTRFNESWSGGLALGGIVALLVAAEASYWLVEQPFIRLRIRRERRARLASLAAA